jgi:hypothetical protein
MSKTRKKQQKAIARRKTKQKESAVRRQRAKEDPVVTAMRRAAHWELASCTINEHWQSSLEAIITVSRKSPTGNFAAAVFIVDLGCTGVVTAIANPEMAPAQFERFSNASTEASEPTELGRVAAILDTAVRFANALGFQPHPEYDAARRLLGDADPSAWPIPVICGRNGKPWFDPDVDQDSDAIAKTLYEHVGPFGFTGMIDPFADEFVPGQLDVSDLPWDERVARADVLMTAMLRFARSDRLLDERTSHLLSRSRIADEQALREIEQEFALTHRGADGRSAIDRYIEDVDTLSSWDRQTLKAWDGQKPIDGVFQVTSSGSEGGAFDSLVDGIRYEVCSVGGAPLLEQLVGVGHVSCSLVPFEGKWLMTGDVLAIQDEFAAAETALDLAQGAPELAFRDPERRRRASEVQRQEAEDFASYFKAPYVLGTGRELKAKLDDYAAWRNEQLEKRSEGEVPAWVRSYPVPMQGPALVVEDLGVTFHPQAGMAFVKQLGRFIEILRTPGSEDNEEQRAFVRRFLDAKTIDRFALQAVLDTFPQDATRVLGRVLERTGFDWTRDGETALRERKGDGSGLPRRLPLVDRVVQAELEHPTRPLLGAPNLHAGRSFAELVEVPPWDWPDDVGTVLRRVMGDPQENVDNRRLAIEMAADYAVDDPGLLVQVRSLLMDSATDEALRVRAALAMGPALELFAAGPVGPTMAWMNGVIPALCDYLHDLYADTSTPTVLRRAALEASSFAAEAWHVVAVREALQSSDVEWMRVGARCMRNVPGFKNEIYGLLDSDDRQARAAAIDAAGAWELDEAWDPLAAIVASPEEDKELTIHAIRALGLLDLKEAAELVAPLEEHEDLDIAEAAGEVVALLEEDEETDELDEDRLKWN